MMLYSCTHMATVGVKGLNNTRLQGPTRALSSMLLSWTVDE